jgi:hypothetical protein
MARPAPRAGHRESSYQRRIRLYKERHPGATTQEARGKKPREHVERARREKEKYQLTPYQRGKIAKDARVQAGRIPGGGDAAEIAAGYVRLVQGQGWGAYQDLRAFITAKHRESLHMGKVVTIRGAAQNRAEMETLAALYGIDISWLYYR